MEAADGHMLALSVELLEEEVGRWMVAAFMPPALTLLHLRAIFCMCLCAAYAVHTCLVYLRWCDIWFFHIFVSLWRGRARSRNWEAGLVT